MNITPLPSTHCSSAYSSAPSFLCFPAPDGWSRLHVQMQFQQLALLALRLAGPEPPSTCQEWALRVRAMIDEAQALGLHKGIYGAEAEAHTGIGILDSSLPMQFFMMLQRLRL